MNHNLDDVDRKILRELQTDGRASFRDISSRIGVSTPTVSARVQAMTDMGLIRGYTTVLDADLLGQVSVVVTVEAKPSEVERVYSRLVGEDMVRQLYVLSDSRLLLMVSYYNPIKYKQFIESLSQIPEIRSVSTSMVLKTPKEIQRAALTDEAGLLIRCYYCGHLIHDEGVKLKIDGKYHYMCCDVCAKLYKEKYDKLKKSA
ncbi:MAG: AsnC family transcriptional regulator [Candidatus Thermoplasmatota archaeon]|nr:AsnC family transcriptional regulator [Candidatus Thermoplasmatota archaeon]